MNVEWWYDDSFFQYGEEDEMFLARLTRRDDGTCQLMLESGTTYDFANKTEASIWLLDEEYRRLESLIDDLSEDGFPPDPRLKPPTATTGDELLRQMIIKLDPPAYGRTTPPAAPPASGLPVDAPSAAV